MVRDSLVWVLLQCLYLEIRHISDSDKRIYNVNNSIQEPSCDKRSNLLADHFVALTEIDVESISHETVRQVLKKHGCTLTDQNRG